MSTFTIEGGCKLKGELEPQGAKNEALQIICATLLTDQDVLINNLPEISDVLKLIEILRNMGVVVERVQKGVYRFNAANVNIDFMGNASIKGIIKFEGASYELPKAVMISDKDTKEHYLNSKFASPNFTVKNISFKEDSRNYKLTIPGIVFRDNRGQNVFASSLKLPDDITEFLSRRGYKVLSLAVS